MAKRFKQQGKRYANDNTSISMKQQSIAVIVIAVLIIMLIIESSLSFFSDVVVNATNAALGEVDITISNVLIEEQDVEGRPDNQAVFAGSVPLWSIRRCKLF